VDTTSIDSLFEIYSNLGGLGEQAMQKEIEQDFADLEEIIGTLNYEEMAVLKTTNPNIFIMIITKIFNYLGYLARIPITDENGNAA
jgi:hypothetical protein